MPYSIVTKDGIQINNIPDDVPRDSRELRDRVIRERMRRDKAQREAQRAALPGPDPDVPVLDEFGRARVVQPPRQQEPSFTAGEYLAAVPEAALTMGSAMTTGLLGQAGGFLGQYARETARGDIGSQEAAQRIQEAAMQSGQRLTYSPSSPAAQQLLGNIGELTEPLQSLDPVVSAQLTNQAAILRNIQQQRRAAETGAALAPNVEAVAAARRAGIDVMGTDVMPPRTATGQMRQRVGERIPFIGTGGMRKTQQQQRIDATRQILQDAGAIDLQNASDKVMKDLLRSRSNLINKYVAEKQEVIDNLSQPIYVKGPGQGKFAQSTNAVPMTRLNQYIDDQLNNQGYLRMAQQGDPDAIAIVDELNQIRANFANNTRLSDIEFKRRMLGETYKAADPGTIKSKAKQIVDNAYGPIVEDMGDFIEAYGGKADKLKWQRANRNLKSNIDDLKDRGFASLLRSGEADPDAITRALLSKKPAKIRTVYKNLSPQGRKTADRLFLNQAYEVAKTPDGMVDPDKFNKFIKQHPTVLDSMAPDVRDQVRGFSKALDLTARAKGAASIPDTGAMNQLPVVTAAVATILGKLSAPVVIGGGAVVSRRIESPARVAKAFQNLGKAPAGSRAERLAINGLNAAIIAENNRLAKEAQRQQEAQQSVNMNGRGL